MNKYQEKMNSLYFYFFEDNRDDFATIENIQQIERQLNLVLPNEYKNFLIDYGLSGFNKGYVYFPIYENCPGGDKGILDVFFGVYPDDPNDILDNYDCYNGRMSPDLFPIAGDPGGNIICMSLNKNNMGAIYFWSHDDEVIVEEGEEIDNSNLYLIANSFEEFINSLELKLYETSNDDDENY